MYNYFQLFGLPEQFNIDNALLEQQYRALAAQFHPDRHASSSIFEQKQSVMMSSTINEAYHILKNPLDRAAYLLKKQNINADSPEHTHFPTEFLMQQMQWRESVQEARAQCDYATLQQLANDIHIEQEKLYENLDLSLTRADWQYAAQLVRQGRFLTKLQNEIIHALPEN